jgi:hypothetical protein
MTRVFTKQIQDICETSLRVRGITNKRAINRVIRCARRSRFKGQMGFIDAVEFAILREERRK